MQSRRYESFHAPCIVVFDLKMSSTGNIGHASLFSLFELSSSRVLELEIDLYDRARVRFHTMFIPWQAELEHRNRARHEFLKNSNELVSSKHYSLKIGLFTSLMHR
jgi:hypothetical protein